MKVLLPESPHETIANFSEKILDKASLLRDAMTVEQAIFKCFMMVTGEEFDERYQMVEEDELAGEKVLVCIFPGLCRVFLRGTEKVRHCVVKASVKLLGLAEIDANSEHCGPNTRQEVEAAKPKKRGRLPKSKNNTEPGGEQLAPEVASANASKRARTGKVAIADLLL